MNRSIVVIAGIVYAAYVVQAGFASGAVILDGSGHRWNVIAFSPSEEITAIEITQVGTIGLGQERIDFTAFTVNPDGRTGAHGWSSYPRWQPVALRAGETSLSEWEGLTPRPEQRIVVRSLTEIRSEPGELWHFVLLQSGESPAFRFSASSGTVLSTWGGGGVTSISVRDFDSVDLLAESFGPIVVAGALEAVEATDHLFALLWLQGGVSAVEWNGPGGSGGACIGEDCWLEVVRGPGEYSFRVDAFSGWPASADVHLLWADVALPSGIGSFDGRKV